MADLQNPKLMYFKGGLFLVAGVLSAGLILLEHRDLKLAMLLGLAIWCFSRAYYLAFYVIEHYIDPSFKFAGLWDFAKYLIRRK
jgi:hypothetical protein